MGIGEWGAAESLSRRTTPNPNPQQPEKKKDTATKLLLIKLSKNDLFTFFFSKYDLSLYFLLSPQKRYRTGYSSLRASSPFLASEATCEKTNSHIFFACCSRVTSRDSLKWRVCLQAKITAMAFLSP